MDYLNLKNTELVPKSEEMYDLDMCHINKKFKSAELCSKKNDQETLRELLFNFNKEITKKLENIERQVDFLSENYDSLEQKATNLSSVVYKHIDAFRTRVISNEHGLYDESVGQAVPISSKVTFISLNYEDDFPNGSWLGNPDNTSCRVRCQISPTELFHIHTTCTTAEKMALTLLDYLFDRETQAASNISGMGKHKKRKLDPLYIYGIQCHLHFNFDITEPEWNKIKQNIDSKCRTAFRRKIRGLPLISKSVHQNEVSNHSDQSCDLQFETNTVNETSILERAIEDANGDIQILYATPEEVARIQQSQAI